MAIVKDTSFIPDMPIGPLDEYRKRAKFDWKELRLIFEDESLLRLKYKTWNKMEADPLFAKPKQTLSADQQKYRAAMQMNATNLLKLAPPNVEQMNHRQKVCCIFTIRIIFCIDFLDQNKNSSFTTDTIFDEYKRSSSICMPKSIGKNSTRCWIIQ